MVLFPEVAYDCLSETIGKPSVSACWQGGQRQETFANGNVFSRSRWLYIVIVVFQIDIAGDGRILVV